MATLLEIKHPKFKRVNWRNNRSSSTAVLFNGEEVEFDIATIFKEDKTPDEEATNAELQEKANYLEVMKKIELGVDL